MKDRSCTDCPCCLVFLAFIVTIVGLGAYGFTEGDIGKIKTPFDQAGNMCGQAVTDGGNTVDLTLYPYKWVYGLMTVSDNGAVTLNPYAAVCVKECPQ